MVYIHIHSKIIQTIIQYHTYKSSHISLNGKNQNRNLNFTSLGQIQLLIINDIKIENYKKTMEILRILLSMVIYTIKS
jgi:hypothetical protein